MFNRTLTDLRVSGAYLPPLIAFHQFIQGETPASITFLSIAGAVVAHGVIRNVFGPGGPEENPLETSTAVQRLYATILAKGPPDNFPESHIEVSLQLLTREIPLERGRVLIIFFSISSLLVWFYTLVQALKKGIFGNIEASITISLLYFALFVWVLQFVIWPRFDPVYLADMLDYPEADEREN